MKAPVDDSEHKSLFASRWRTNVFFDKTLATRAVAIY